MATQKEVAEHIDLSDRQVRNLLQSGVLPASKGVGGYSLDDCRLAYIRYLRAQASGQARRSEPDDDEDSDVSGLEEKKLEEEFRWTRERRIAQQLKNEVASRQQLPAEFASFALSRLAAEITSILDTLPLTIKRRHPDLEARHLDTLNRELALARNQAAGLDGKLPEVLDEYFQHIEGAN